jgi:hypothetical protein
MIAKGSDSCIAYSRNVKTPALSMDDFLTCVSEQPLLMHPIIGQWTIGFIA